MKNIYFKGKGLYKKLFNHLHSYPVYDDEVIPWFEDKNYDYVDHIPNHANEEAEVYLDGQLLAKNNIQPDGTFHANIKLKLGHNKLHIVINGNTYKEQVIITKHYPIFLLALADYLVNVTDQLNQTNLNLFYDSVETGKVFENFGYLFDFVKRSDFPSEKYRDCVVGNESANKPGLLKAIRNAGTERAIIDLIVSCTGIEPKIERLPTGWRVYSYNDIAPYGTDKVPKWVDNGDPPDDNDPDNELNHYFVKGNEPYPLGNALPTLKIYSGKTKSFTIQVTVYNAEIQTTETVIRGAGTVDDLDRELIVDKELVGLVITDEDGNTYDINTDFELVLDGGQVKWIGSSPSTGKKYTITYWFYPIEELEFLVKKLKPAYINIKFIFENL